MVLVFATNNAHKLDEARMILPNYTILSLNEIGLLADIPETADTLEGNSRLKADFVYDWCMRHVNQLPADVAGCFADDTGLEIHALDGAPGVYSARWSGPEANSKSNCEKALRELKDKTDRSAHFRTVVTLYLWNLLESNDSTKLTADIQFDGIVRGTMATEEKGDHGFGYDPLFIPEGYDEPFAVLPYEIKNKISHRARAMQALAEYLNKVKIS
ncbi:MAG: non-canonical purine NTP pyrophosphatase [Paludibacteraceae bacterium]|nr:non-canonical purine NTP pyrophosphatase [Paludibacteraceae bacterium]